MEGDWLTDAVTAAEAAVGGVRAALDVLDAALVDLRESRRRGATTLEAGEQVSRPVRQARLAAAVAFRDLERSLLIIRSRSVHELVGQGVSLAELSRRWGVSRQVLGRLHQAALDEQARQRQPSIEH